MVELNNLGKHRKGRIWDGKIPVTNTQYSNSCKRVISSATSTFIDKRELALELYYPRNTSNYGMLGVKFVPNDSNEIEVVVNSSKNIKEVYSTSLVSEYDRVFFGINKEYCNTIADSAVKAIKESQKYPSGKIEFCIGAYSEVGSSQIVFSKLTKILIELLLANHKEHYVMEKIVSENM